jgi:teichoic acid transport system permease protein
VTSGPFAGDQARLRRIDTPPTLSQYLRDLWSYREFIVATARYDHRAENNVYALGRLWFFLTPLLRIGVYWLVFGALLAGRRPEGFIAFLAIGIFLFRFMQSTIQSGAVSPMRNRSLTQALPIPHALLPITLTLRQFLSFRYEALVMLITVVAVTRTISAGWLLLVLVVIPLATLFALGGALLLAPAVARLRDVEKVFPFIFRFFFYTSGVLFPVSLLVDQFPILRFLPYVPFYAFVALSRHLVLTPDAMAPLLWRSATVWALGSVTVGLWVFRANERRFGHA